MENVDAVVIGAGVVGLAIARELALRGHETLILEAAARFGTGVSARNSEVIHAGIYHPPGFLKSRLCVAGRERLYEFCRKRGVGHQRCGKLIVATAAVQLPALEKLAASAQANGVDLVALEGAQARRIEPELACAAALYSPLTGIIDCQGLMLALLGEAQALGTTLSTGSTDRKSVV
jgi:L-2-hydroxyglutarate oxidase LhgO